MHEDNDACTAMGNAQKLTVVVVVMVIVIVCNTRSPGGIDGGVPPVGPTRAGLPGVRQRTGPDRVARDRDAR